MAIPDGQFIIGVAGMIGVGGAFRYPGGPGVGNPAFPQYFGGSFFIDTGYDDPVLWQTGVDAAEVYVARVYPRTASVITGALSAGAPMSDWRIVASPGWETKFWVPPGTTPTSTRRIWIKCDAYCANPANVDAGTWYRLESVDWSLYRA